MFFHQGEPPTEEQIAEYNAQQERAEMERTAFSNECQAWLDGLGPRETLIFRQILICAHNDNDYISRQIGEANGRMKYLHNVDVKTGLPEGAELFDAGAQKISEGDGES